MKVLCKECGKTNNLKNTCCSYCGNPLNKNVWQKTLLNIQKNIKLVKIIFIVLVVIISLALFIIHKSLIPNILGTWYNSKSPYTDTFSRTDFLNSLDDFLKECYIESNVNILDGSYSIEDYIIFKPKGVCEFYKIYTNIDTKETDTHITTYKYKFNFNGTKIKIIDYPMPFGKTNTYFPISNNTIKFEFYDNGDILTCGEYVKK